MSLNAFVGCETWKECTLFKLWTRIGNFMWKLVMKYNNVIHNVTRVIGLQLLRFSWMQGTNLLRLNVSCEVNSVWKVTSVSMRKAFCESKRTLKCHGYFPKMRNCMSQKQYWARKYFIVGQHLPRLLLGWDIISVYFGITNVIFYHFSKYHREKKLYIFPFSPILPTPTSAPAH